MPAGNQILPGPTDSTSATSAAEPPEQERPRGALESLEPDDEQEAATDEAPVSLWGIRRRRAPRWIPEG